MNKGILFFSVNRHQKKYFDHLLSTIKLDDKGISVHKRNLVRIIPSLNFSKDDVALAKEAALIRMGYFYNKSDRKIHAVFRVFIMAIYLPPTFYFTLKFKKYITKHRFDIILLWNDMKWHQYIIKNIAKRNKIKTAFFENGALPNTVTFDSEGVNHNNCLPRDSEFYLKKYDADNLNPVMLPKIKAEESGYIFVPFQVDYDTQIISHSPWISNMEDLYKVLERLVDNLPERLNLIIKEHPSSSRCYKHLHNKNPRIEFRNTEETNELISNSEMVITINSTVGLESIIKDKPLIVLGKAFYAIDGLCNQVERESDLNRIVHTCEHPNRSIKNAFVRYLKEVYYVPGNWKSPSVEHTKAIEIRLYEFIGKI